MRAYIRRKPRVTFLAGGLPTEMSALAPIFPFPSTPVGARRVPVQWNWITDAPDHEPEQLLLPFPDEEPDELRGDAVTLLATENGAQLYVSGHGVFLGKKSERVVIRHEGRVCGELPLLKLQEIVVASRGVTVSSDLLEHACVRNVRIAFLSGGGTPYALVTSPLLTATVETRKAQIASLESKVGVEIARYLVAGKLRNQEKLLRYFARTRPDARGAALVKAAASLKGLRGKALGVEGERPEEVRGALMGLEGAGGRLYWEQWVNLLPEGLGFEARRHQGPRDAVNACLNYGYGILTGHVWGAVMNAGLEPFAGFLHTDRSGKPSLVLDLMEEFRQPVVDRAIFAWVTKGGSPKLLGNGFLDQASKEEVAQRILARLNVAEVHRGKSHQVRSIIQMQARLCASAVRGKRSYRPFSFQW